MSGVGANRRSGLPKFQIYMHVYLGVYLLAFNVVFQLGANAILAVSLAVCKAGAHVKKIPLYKVCYAF